MPITITKQYGRDTKEVELYTVEELNFIFGGNIIRAGESVGLQAELNERLTTARADLDQLNNVVIPAIQQDISDLDDQLNNPTTGLQAQINTLDGYFDDPSTIPAGYSFFEGIVTNAIWSQSVVAIEGWFNTITANQLFVDKMVANEAVLDVLKANQAWVDTIYSNTIVAGNAIVFDAWVDSLIANDIFADKITANEISVTNLQAVSASTGNLTVSGWLRSGNYVAGTSGYTINSDGSAEFSNVYIRGTSSVEGSVLVGGSVEASKLDVNTLEAVTTNTGNLTVSGTIQSATYTLGSTGFIIRADGTAEFEDIVLRGDILDATIVNTLLVPGVIMVGSKVKFGETEPVPGSVTPSYNNNPVDVVHTSSAPSNLINYSPTYTVNNTTDAILFSITLEATETTSDFTDFGEHIVSIERDTTGAGAWEEVERFTTSGGNTLSNSSSGTWTFVLSTFDTQYLPWRIKHESTWTGSTTTDIVITDIAIQQFTQAVVINQSGIYVRTSPDNIASIGLGGDTTISSAASVSSVFGRTGSVTAQVDDYSKAQIAGLKDDDSPTFAGATFTGAISATAGTFGYNGTASAPLRFGTTGFNTVLARFRADGEGVDDKEWGLFLLTGGDLNFRPRTDSGLAINTGFTFGREGSLQFQGSTVIDSARNATFVGGTFTGTLDVSGETTALRLRLTSTADVSVASTDHAFQIGASSAANLRMDANEIQALDNGALTTLYIQNEGGGTYFGGSLTITGGVTASGTVSGNTFTVNGSAGLASLDSTGVRLYLRRVNSVSYITNDDTGVDARIAIGAGSVSPDDLVVYNGRVDVNGALNVSGAISGTTGLFTGLVNVNTLAPNVFTTSGFRIKDPASNQGFFFGNATSAGFIPYLLCETRGDSNDSALLLTGHITPANDTGNSPVLWFNARRNDSTAIASRKLFQLSNNGVERFHVNHNGNASLTGDLTVNDVILS